MINKMMRNHKKSNPEPVIRARTAKEIWDTFATYIPGPNVLSPATLLLGDFVRTLPSKIVLPEEAQQPARLRNLCRMLASSPGLQKCGFSTTLLAEPW